MLIFLSISGILSNAQTSTHFKCGPFAFQKVSFHVPCKFICLSFVCSSLFLFFRHVETFFVFLFFLIAFQIMQLLPSGIFRKRISFTSTAFPLFYLLYIPCYSSFYFRAISRLRAKQDQLTHALKRCLKTLSCSSFLPVLLSFWILSSGVLKHAEFDSWQLTLISFCCFRFRFGSYMVVCQRILACNVR